MDRNLQLFGKQKKDEKLLGWNIVVRVGVKGEKGRGSGSVWCNGMGEKARRWVFVLVES